MQQTDILSLSIPERFTQAVTRFISGKWGTFTAFVIMIAWLAGAPWYAHSALYGFIDQLLVIISFVLLFLLQRAQSKDTLSLQIKINELLAAVHEASPALINIEERSEEELQDLHDKFQQIQQHGPGSHSIEQTLKSENNGTVSKQKAQG